MKITLRMLMLIVFAFLLAVTVSAHPGRTDGNGGHYDRSTGEYHYHHGYEAHQHTDLDGDGIPDCPYLFDDKTNHSSGDSSGGSSIIKPNTSPATKPAVSSTQPVKATEPEETAVEMLVRNPYAWIAAVVVVLVIVSFINSQKEKKIQAEKKRLAEEQFQKERQDFLATYGGKPTSAFVHIPDDSEIGPDDLPREKAASTNDYWGKKYTFYVSPYGSSYHKTDGCSKSYIPINAYKCRPIRNVSSRRPCARCNPVIPDFSWVDEYHRIEALRKKYKPEDSPQPK